MKSVKLGLGAILVASSISLSPVAVSASEKNQDLKDFEVVNASDYLEKNNEFTINSNIFDYEEIIEDYELKDIDISDLPEDAVIMEVESEEELNLLMENLEKELEVVEEINDQIHEDDTFSIMNTGKFTRTTSQRMAITGKVNLTADFWVRGSGSFYQMDDVKGMRSYLTGFTYPASWKGSTPYKTIASNKMSASAHASGNVQYYLLIQGFLKVYEEHRSLTVSYKINR